LASILLFSFGFFHRYFDPSDNNSDLSPTAPTASRTANATQQASQDPASQAALLQSTIRVNKHFLAIDHSSQQALLATSTSCNKHFLQPALLAIGAILSHPTSAIQADTITKLSPTIQVNKQRQHVSWHSEPKLSRF
jgi:hypothetical protein